MTGLQMARAMCVIANGGLMVQPTLKRVDPADLLHRAPVFERVLSKRASETTLATMRRVHQEGLFEVRLAADPGRYRLRLRTGEQVATCDDAYRFGSPRGR